MKTKTIPFDLETAKKIQAGEIEGKIKTKGNDVSRIICWDRKGGQPIIALIQGFGDELAYLYNSDGIYYRNDRGLDLVLEVPDNEPQFKPFDKVLVRGGASTAIQERNIWVPAYYQHHDYSRYVGDDEIYFASGLYWRECIPYEGNQELVGTCNEPKCK